MKSPFPGMDPYLESTWGDVHTSLIKDARDALNRKLPQDLVAEVEERGVIEQPRVSALTTGASAECAPIRLVLPEESQT